MLTSFPVNEIQYIEKTERKENFLIFLDLNLNRARTWLFIYITFNTLHVALRYLLLTFSITGHCINLLQVFLLPRPIIALPSSRAFCMFSKRSFILEFRESFQVSNSSRQELSWSSSWSNASYSEAKKEEMFVIDQARGQDGWLLVEFFFFFFIETKSRSIKMQKRRRQYPTILTEQSVFTWRHSGHIGVPKQWNGGHVGVQENPLGVELFSHVNNFFCSN